MDRETEMELGAMASEVDGVMRRAGVTAHTRVRDGQLVYEMIVPTRTGSRPVVVSARVAMPDEVGAKKGLRRVKEIAKKVAKSKVLGKMAKGIIPLATIIPGLQPLAAGLAVAVTAQKIALKAAKGSKKAQKVLKKAVQGGRLVISTARAATSLPGRVPVVFRVTRGGRTEQVTL